MQMPDAQTYEKSIEHWPYKESVAFVIDRVADRAPRNGRVLDIMCGTGYMLGKIAEKRRDLTLVGVDISAEYIDFARATCTEVDFKVGDVCSWRAPPFDLVLCAGAVHHVPYAEQPAAIENIAALTREGGLAIISDCYIDSYKGEMARQFAAAKLGHEYLRSAIRSGAPREVIDWTMEIMRNDVQKIEFKDSIENRVPLFERCFKDVAAYKMWPGKTSGYGDYIHICSR